MTDETNIAFEAFKRAIEAAEEDGRMKGIKEGRAQVSDTVNELVNEGRAALLEQGRVQGVEETKVFIEKAREEGRVQGVEDGLLQAQITSDKRIKNDAFKEGEHAGRRAGLKEGRGEGYKAGWNDAVNTPVRDQKAR